jgi:D-allose transport system substrate-binding protein
MKKTKILVLLMALAMVVCVLAGCGSEQPAEETTEEPAAEESVQENALLAEAEASMLEQLGQLPEAGNGEKIGAVAFSMTNEFWVTVSDGYKDAAEEYGCTVDVVAAENEADEQSQYDAMMNLLSKDYDALAISAMTGTNLVPAVAEANKQGLTVVAVGTSLDETAAKDAGASVAAFVTCDFYGQGYDGATWIMEQLGDEAEGAEVAVIAGQAGAANAELRKSGAEDAFNEAGANIVLTEYADWDRQKAYDMTTNLIQAHPELKGIMCGNDDMALGCVEALKAADMLDQVKVVGTDFIEEAKQSIKNGELSGTVVMSPYLFGKAGLILALQAIQGIEITVDELDTPYGFVTIDNVDDYEGWR